MIYVWHPFQIQDVLEQRKSVNPITPTPHNYPIKTKKIIKEYGKVSIASKDCSSEHLIYETAGLWCHDMMCATSRLACGAGVSEIS